MAFTVTKIVSVSLKPKITNGCINLETGRSLHFPKNIFVARKELQSSQWHHLRKFMNERTRTSPGPSVNHAERHVVLFT